LGLVLGQGRSVASARLSVGAMPGAPRRPRTSGWYLSMTVAAAAAAAAAAPTSLAAAWSCTNFAAATGHPGPDPGLFPDGRGRVEEPDGPEEPEPEELESPEAPDASEGSEGSRTSAEDLDGGGVGRTGREPGLVPGGTALAESGLALAGVCLARDTAGTSAVASRPRAAAVSNAAATTPRLLAAAAAA